MHLRPKILVVDDEPEVYEIITEQIITDGSCEFEYAANAEAGIQRVASYKPDLIILDLVMPGLTGNDVLVAIKRLGYYGPIIVITKKGAEQKAIEAFRLGASDFITKPIRPPELLAAIERAFEEIKLRQEKNTLLEKLQTANQALETKVRELTLLSDIGRHLASMQSLDDLLELAMKSTLEITSADYSAVLLRSPQGKFILKAGKNLTLVLQEKLGEEMSDDVAELVLNSQEPLVAAGEGLQRFKLPRDIRAVIYVPLVARDQKIGVLSVGNTKKRTEFSEGQAELMRSVADYVALGISNTMLFAGLQNRAREIEQRLQSKEAERGQWLERLHHDIHQPLQALDGRLTQWLAASPQQSQTLRDLHSQVHQLLEACQALTVPDSGSRTIRRLTSS